MKTELIKAARQGRRMRRVRKRVVGLPARPRLAVSRSHRGMYVQIIDDSTGRTLCGLSTWSKDLREQVGYGGNAAAAALLGKALAVKARELGVEQVCFDRRSCRYHGRIKALADAAREAGLKF